MTRLVILGGGAFARQCLLALREDCRELVFVADDTAGALPEMRFIDRHAITPADEMVIAVADPTVRRRLATGLAKLGQVVAPTALFSSGASIGGGRSCATA